MGCESQRPKYILPKRWAFPSDAVSATATGDRSKNSNICAHHRFSASEVGRVEAAWNAVRNLVEKSFWQQWLESRLDPQAEAEAANEANALTDHY
jgi:hypothetical protein